MNRRAVEQSKVEALRFIGKCDELLMLKVQTYDGSKDGAERWGMTSWTYQPSPESATVRRASMDLTRELAKLRKS